MTKRTMRCPHKDKVSDCKECMAILNPTPPPYDEEQTIRDILCDLLATGRVIGKERPITPDEWEKHILGSEAAIQALILRAQIAVTEKCWAQINPADRGWKEVAAILEALQQQLKEVEGQDK